MEKGSNNSIKFRSNADFAEFVKVTVDGKDLDLNIIQQIPVALLLN